MSSRKRSVGAMLLEFRDDMVTLLVGPYETKMAVHASHLQNSSEFSKLALQKWWQEGEERTIRLPEERPDDFRYYLHFLYKHEIATEPLDNPAGFDIAERYAFHADLYLLGERMQDRDFKNAIIDCMIETNELRNECNDTECPHVDTITTVYEGTPAPSPMRRLLVDMYVRQGDATWFAGADMRGGHPDFMADLVAALYLVAHGSYCLGEQYFKCQDYHEKPEEVVGIP
ncbi:hypothetical protein B0A48_12669 [Cryoendolithus antarcticus]|uniref:BTB domain-containing protein n=1 Tax=Cryoendolithus antarcticus TaxID=1507870 RepID=A0A1V8SR42_9PEZI|nr:hypothetical protein B0A48_12669 [Cryoendolithus antarcticus]